MFQVLVSILSLFFLIYTTSITNVVRKAVVSDAGSDHHTPSAPIHKGRSMSSGRRKIIWRESDRNMLIFAFPIDWKKLVVTA